MKQNIIIELSKEVALKLKETPRMLDVEHPIYNKFSIIVDCDIMYNMKEITETIALMKKVNIEFANKLVSTKANNWKLSIDVSYKDDFVKFVVMDKLVNSKIFEGKIPKVVPIPVPVYSSFTREEDEERAIAQRVAILFNNIIAGVVFSLDSSNYKVIESKQRVDAGKKNKKKKNKSSNAKYITTKRYIVNSLVSNDNEDKEGVHREYKKDAWQVKGFWAKTRNGRVYWREPSVRKRRKGKINSSNETDQLTLKLNKLPEDN